MIIKKAEKKIGLLEGLLSKSDLLRDGLKAVPYIGAALQFVRAFAGDGKQSSVPQTVEMMPMSINPEISLTGTILTQKVYKNIVFSTPGSLKSKCVANDLYPYYNEVLGVINLLSTPEVRVKEGFSFSNWVDEYGPQYQERRFFQVQLTNLDYVLNPASGLRPDNIEIIGSLIFKNSPTGPTVYETSFMPIQTLLSTKVELGHIRYQGLFNEYYMLGCSSYEHSPIYIEVKLIANLTRSNAGSNTQNVLWVGTPSKYLTGTTIHFPVTRHV
jgi:hypothetical protein